MTPDQIVILYFRDRLRAAGYECNLGYVQPDLGRATNEDIQCELWLTNGEGQMWENTETPIETSALIECYIFRTVIEEDKEGQWYSDVVGVRNVLASNKQDRAQMGKIWWDNRIVPTDFVSPLKRWNNSSEYSPGILCARIDLPVNYLKTL